MEKTAKYLNELGDNEYREDFQQRLNRITSIPHLSEEVRQEMVEDLILRYDRRNELADFVIEGIVTKRQIENAYRNHLSEGNG